MGPPKTRYMPRRVLQRGAASVCLYQAKFVYVFTYLSQSMNAIFKRIKT